MAASLWDLLQPYERPSHAPPGIDWAGMLEGLSQNPALNFSTGLVSGVPGGPGPWSLIDGPWANMTNNKVGGNAGSYLSSLLRQIGDYPPPNADPKMLQAEGDFLQSMLNAIRGTGGGTKAGMTPWGREPQGGANIVWETVRRLFDPGKGGYN